MRRLRAPDGCPWDREQTLADARGYLLEEAHEVAAAIDGGDPDEVAAELGDLFFQSVFVATLLEERDEARLVDMLTTVHSKMVDRHPHVFGDVDATTADEVNRIWEARKARDAEAGRSILDGVPASLPALLAAYRLTQKAAGVGFDWSEPEPVYAKVEEELDEVRSATGAADPTVAEEVGDLLFAVVNLSRHLGVDPEGALAATNRKFRRRFAHVERELAARGRRPDESDLEEMDRLWEDAKRRETR